ncbi:MAG: hypothetical protein JWL96_949 [Sphingomonas bacterium]|uniref:hypothetical protein n=1 Tax=Sphingomonas bacterium TaxID=1895847 RepID=UPI0026384B61|nr:hypothetical protein [Sphingomonas bacterium]MDB5708879.1 hypothetical protein [Sphingomonas bacterium]
MFVDVHLARVKQAFAAQFTADRDGHIYRRGQRGPGIRVTAAERDRFVETFERGVIRLAWSMVLAATLLLGALALFSIELPWPLSGHEEAVATLLLIASFMLAWWWIRNAPMRALERRATIDQGLPVANYRRAMLVAMPWSIPVIAALFQVALIVRVAVFEPDPFGRQQWSYYAVAAVGLTGMAVIAWFKWRASR